MQFKSRVTLSAFVSKQNLLFLYVPRDREKKIKLQNQQNQKQQLNSISSCCFCLKTHSRHLPHYIASDSFSAMIKKNVRDHNGNAFVLLLSLNMTAAITLLPHFSMVLISLCFSLFIFLNNLN